MSIRSRSPTCVVICAAVCLGCAIGVVDRQGVWGYAVGNAKISNCITETTMELVQRVQPDGATVMAEEPTITRIVEECHTISGGHMSPVAGGFFSTLLTPLRAFGGMLVGAGSTGDGG